MRKSIAVRVALIAILAGAVVLAMPGGALDASDQVIEGLDDDVCPRIVREALELAAKGCEATGRNEACYGHTDLEAQPQPEVESFVFTEAGDIVKVSQMRSLRLGEMNEQAQTWGIALLRVQANLPDSSPENVTVVLFGDTQITDNTPETLVLPAYVAAGQNVNARRYPNSTSAVLMSLPPGTEVQATGRLADSSWLRILLPETGQTAWVFASLMASDEDLSALAVVSSGSEMLRPMQAFTLQSGVDDAPCVEAPQSGLIIQTPDGVGQVTFLVNEVDIQVGSSAFLQAAPGQQMNVAAISGTVTVTANGVTQVVPAGTVVSIPLEGTTASGPPGLPPAYPADLVQALPVSLLPNPVTPAAPYVPPAVVVPVQPGVPGQPAPTAAPGQPVIPGQPVVPGQPVPTTVPGQPVPTTAPGEPTPPPPPTSPPPPTPEPTCIPWHGGGQSQPPPGHGYCGAP